MISQDSFFVENYPNDAKFYYGLISLNNFYGDKGYIDIPSINSRLIGLFSNVSSRTNIKSTSEILSHFLICSEGVNTLSGLLNVDEKLFQLFFELSL